MPKANDKIKFANVTVITDKATLTKRIATLAKDMKSIDNRIHTIAVSTMYHMQQHGDVRGAQELLEAMPRSTRRKALIAWYEDFGPLTIDPKTSSVELTKGRTPDQFKLEECAEVHFGDYTTERAPVPVTLEAIVAMVEKKLEKGIEQGNITDEQGVSILDALSAVSSNDDEEVSNLLKQQAA